MSVNRARLRTCKVCKSRYEPHLPMQVVCGIECAKSLAVSVRGKAEKKRAVQERSETRRRKEAIKTIPQLMKEAQAAFNEFIRLRDAGKCCISCRASLPAEAVGGGYDCGHFRSTGSASHLRFNEDNAHGQCKRCNRYRGGNVLDYRARLYHVIGAERLAALESDNRVHKWTREELIEIRDHYRAKVKEMRKC